MFDGRNIFTDKNGCSDTSWCYEGPEGQGRAQGAICDTTGIINRVYKLLIENSGLVGLNMAFNECSTASLAEDIA